METIFKRVLIIAAIISLLLFLVTMVLPNEFIVVRKIVINAPKETIFPVIADLSRWQEWTMWNQQQDSSLEFTYSDYPQGVGAIMQWNSEHSGSGAINIIQSNPFEGIIYRMVLEERLQSQGSILFDAASATTTTVIWTSTGKLSGNPLMRYFTLFMDRLMGPDMEDALKSLKKLTEKVATVNPN